MKTAAQIFSEKGLDWDAPFPARGATPFKFEAVEDVLYRRTYDKAQGYDGRVRRPRYDGKNCHPVGKPVEARPALLEHRNETWVPPEPASYVSFAPRHSAPKEPSWDRADIEAEHEKKAKEFSEWLRKERQKLA